MGTHFDRNRCAVALGPPQHRQLASSVPCGSASSALVTGTTSRITAAARILLDASCASAAMQRRAQRFCKRRRRPRSLCRGELPNFQFPASAFAWTCRSPKNRNVFKFQVRFRDSRVQIAVHKCSPFDVPVPICGPKPSSTFFTNQIRLRFRPNFQFPVSHVAASPRSPISIHLISSFQFPFRFSQATSNQFPVSSFQSCNLTATKGPVSSFQLPGAPFHQDPKEQGDISSFQFPGRLLSLKKGCKGNKAFYLVRGCVFPETLREH